MRIYIDHGPVPGNYSMHTDYLLPYPTDVPIANLQLADMAFLQETIFINQRLGELYDTWDSYSIEWPCDARGSWFRFLTEEIAYWLRTSLDFLVQTTAILGTRIECNEWPNQIVPDSAAGVLASIDRSEKLFGTDIFLRHAKVINQINTISNVFKHCYICHETINYREVESPCFFYLGSERNRIVEIPPETTCFYDLPKSGGIPVHKVIEAFNALLRDFREQHSIWIVEINGDSTKE